MEKNNRLRELTKKIEKMEWRFNLAMQVCEFAAWEWRVDTDELIWDDNMYDILGCDRTKYETLQEAFKDVCNEEDLVIIEKQVKVAIDDLGQQYDFSFRLKDGKKRIKSKGVVLKNGDKSKRVMVGVCIVDCVYNPTDPC